MVTYPEFFQPGGSGGYIGCQAIRSSDQDWINEQIITANGLIDDAAGEAGFEHVDMGDVLLGHQLCTDDPALEGVRLDDVNASFHPNASGHSLLADRIEDRLGRTVTPSFTVQQGETVTGTFTIRGSAFTLNTGWPGSDVVSTLVSPSGARYSREATNGAVQGNGPTWEYLTVATPEPGVWTYEVFGADVDAGGEPVTLRLFDDVPRNQPPVPVVTTTQTGSTVTFDATGTTDADGTVVEYRWDFADGATAVGPVVSHTFAPGTYDVTLTVVDDDGAKGFGHTDDLVRVGSDPTAATVYSGSSLTLTNSFSAMGEGADVLVNGDFRCNSLGHVAGDVTVLGAAYLTNSCRVDGTLWAAGGVTMDSTSRVGGDVLAVGAVRFQSTAQVAGDIRTASSFTVTDGLSVEALKAKGSLGGPSPRGQRSRRQGRWLRRRWLRSPPPLSTSRRGTAGCAARRLRPVRPPGPKRCPRTRGAPWRGGPQVPPLSPSTATHGSTRAGRPPGAPASPSKD